MHRTSIARLAAVLSLAALAACDTPTAIPAGPAARVARPAHDLAVAQVTVTNWGGTPLVSWEALTDATSYTVRLITYNTADGRYVSRGFQTLGTTTGTSYLDAIHVYTGTYQCTGVEGPDGVVRGHWYEYEVVSSFPTGTSSARHFAPIVTALCRVRTVS
jgi:hypothetical protein